MSYNNHLNEKKVCQISKKLSFGRLIGTQGERESLKLITTEFKKAGYENIYRESFKTSFHHWNSLRILIILNGVLLFLIPLSFYLNPFLTILVILIDILFLIKFLLLIFARELSLSKDPKKNFNTSNLYVDLDSIKQKTIKTKVVFFTNWDSKNQLIPKIIANGISFIIAISSLVIIIIYSFLIQNRIYKNAKIYRYLPLNNYLLIYCLFIAVIGLLNFLNRIKNNKAKYGDNSESIGAIIELAKYFKNHPMKYVNFVFLTTASQVFKSQGVYDFISRHENEFNSESTYFINLRTSDSRISPEILTKCCYKRMLFSEKLISLFCESAKRFNIKLERDKEGCCYFDFLPISNKGFHTCVLTLPTCRSKNERKTSKIKINEGIKNGLLLCISLIQELELEQTEKSSN